MDALLRGPVDHTGRHYRVRAEFRPSPVQQPRPPIWVAGVAPHRRPLARARRWDGVVPIGADGFLTPEQLAGYLALDGGSAAAGWDVVAHPAPGIPAQDYADAGASWLVESAFPACAGWEADLEKVVRAGPDRA